MSHLADAAELSDGGAQTLTPIRLLALRPAAIDHFKPVHATPRAKPLTLGTETLKDDFLE